MTKSKTGPTKSGPANIETAVADRRSFLKLAGATAAAGGTALVPGAAAAEDTTKAEQLYRETDHIRRYYELAK